MDCYLFKQDNEEFITSSEFKIDSNYKYKNDNKLLIITKEKLFETKITSVEETILKFNAPKEIELFSEDFKKYIIEVLFKENDKEELNEKYHYLLEGKEGAISVLGYLEVVKKRTETFKIKLFRGHSSTSWNLQPSLYRVNYIIGRERELFRDIKKLNFKDFKEQDNFINTLCRMQHYGIPTTLLDWTKNPLTALFFSCLPPKGKNAEVIYIEPKNYYSYDSEEFSIFNGLLENQYNSLKPIDDISFRNQIIEIYKKNSNVYFIETIFENDRVKAQNGLFSFSLNFNLEELPKIKVLLKSKVFHINFDDINKKITTTCASIDKKYCEDFLNLLKHLDGDKIEIFDIKKRLDYIDSAYSKKVDIKKELKEAEILCILEKIDEIVKEKIIIIQELLNTKCLEKSKVLNSIIIPDEKREEILKELNEVFNINFVTTYPDINGFSQYLKAKYN